MGSSESDFEALMLRERIVLNDYDGVPPKRMMWDFHRHRYFEFSFVLTGKLTVLFDDRTYQTGGNSIILSRPQTNHYIINEQGYHYHRRNLLFTEQALEGLTFYEQKMQMLFRPGGGMLCLNDSVTRRLDGLLTDLKNEPVFENRQLLLALILSIAADQPQDEVGETTLPPYYYIGEVMRYIGARYSERLVAEEIATRFFVSRTKLMTDFKKKTGKTLLEYITAVRVEKAKACLSAGEGVSQTAAVCGFQNTGNFIRVFKKQTGMTPGSYREQIETAGV